MLSRKKRRGIIEKRRRDRINTSLSELRRLVPTAYEKQGSAKLEKAEILQMTVDHLKMLHAKGKCPPFLILFYALVNYQRVYVQTAKIVDLIFLLVFSKCYDIVTLTEPLLVGSSTLDDRNIHSFQSKA